MVSSLSIVFMAVSFIIAVGLPVGLTIWVMKKYKPGFWAVASGMIVFFVLQGLIRIPLMQIFSASAAGAAFIQNNVLLYTLIASVSAGIFEEFGRYFAFKVMLKRKREFGHGLAYGIGHGGIEAVLLVGIAYVSNILLSMMINSGSLSSLEGMLGTAMQPAIAALTDTPSVMFLVGGIERIFAICLHLGLSILVLYGVRKRNIAYTLLAILIHGAANFGAVMLAQYAGAVASEAFLLVVAVLSIVFVVRMRKVFEKQDKMPELV